MRRRGPVVLLVVAVVLLAGLFAVKRCGAGDDTAGTQVAPTDPTADISRHGDGNGHGRTVAANASLAGKVTRSDTGAPVADAVVAIAPAELMAMFVRGSAPTQIATTDATGTWRVTNVRPGAYVIAATAIDYLPSPKLKLAIASGEQRTGVDLAVTPGGTTVRGTVSDVGGGPIPGARITAHAGDPRDMLGGVADYVAVTNATGQYKITLPDGSIELEAAHDDYTTRTHRVELAGAPQTVDFTLIPGSVVRGQVIARDTGKGVPGAIVHAERGGRGAGGGGGGPSDGTAFADDDGNFVLRSLGSGTLGLKAIGRGYASTDATSVPIGIGETVEGVRVLVDRAYSISGHTRRKGKAEPVPGITLGAFAIVERTLGIALEPSAKDGAFEIVGVRPGNYTVFAVGEGSVPDVGTNVAVVDKDVTGVVVELEAGVTVSGTVAPPVAGAALGIELAGGVGLGNMFDAVKTVLVHGETDKAGAFVLTNVPSGSFKLVADAKDGAHGELALGVKDADVANLVVPLAPRASIAGRVADTSGKPVADISVDAEQLDGDPGKKVKFRINDRGQGGVRTGADGAFKIVGLDAGKYRVVASADGMARFRKRPPDPHATELTLAAGEAKAGVALVVEARDATITGIVMGTDKKPIGDAWIRARPAVDKDDPSRGWGGTAAPPVLADGDGRFAIKNLVKGTYDLEVEGPRGATHGEKPGVKTGDDVTIELLAFGSLSGTVTLAGAPVTKYTIDCDLDGPGGEATRLVEAKDGAYALEHLAPGHYKCGVESDGGTGKGELDVPAGPAKLDVALTRWASITGTVVSVLDRSPIAGVHVFAGGEYSSRNMGAILAGNAPTTDASGRFVIDHVAVGNGKVAVMPKRGFEPLGSADYTIAEGQHVDVGAIAVVPPHDGEDGTFGLTTKVEDGKLVVGDVYPDGPAAKAGVQVGDVIQSIDGVDIGKLTPPIGSFMLTSGNVGVGTPAILGLARAGGSGPVMATLTSTKW